MKIKDKNIIFNDSAKNQKELFMKVEEKLVREEVVKEGFGSSLLEREKAYPTGLSANGMKIAICHTDPKYALTNEIMFIKLHRPIEFKTMDTRELILVNYVFVLVLKDGHDHMKVLQSIVEMMQNKECIENIKNAENKEEMTLALKCAFRS